MRKTGWKRRVALAQMAADRITDADAERLVALALDAEAARA